jgi:hypothetical protein
LIRVNTKTSPRDYRWDAVVFKDFGRRIAGEAGGKFIAKKNRPDILRPGLRRNLRGDGLSRRHGNDE